LQGRTKSEGGEPEPVVLAGEDKAVSSNKIGSYVNEELRHYWQFYQYAKHAGQPFNGGWLDCPEWVPQIMLHFDNAVDIVRAHNEREAYKQSYKGIK